MRYRLWPFEACTGERVALAGLFAEAAFGLVAGSGVCAVAEWAQPGASAAAESDGLSADVDLVTLLVDECERAPNHQGPVLVWGNDGAIVHGWLLPWFG